MTLELVFFLKYNIKAWLTKEKVDNWTTSKTFVHQKRLLIQIKSAYGMGVHFAKHLFDKGLNPKYKKNS